MEKERRIKGLSLVALVVAVLGLTVAFAALSTQLTIEGSASVSKASWDVHFANLSDPTKAGATIVATEDGKGIQTDTTKIVLPTLTFTKPGDTVTYTFDVVNGGTIDAKVDVEPTCTRTVTATATDADKNAADKKMVEDNFTCELTYADGTKIGKDNELLNKDTNTNTKQMKLTVGYPTTATEVPSNDVNISDITVTMTYVQK